MSAIYVPESGGNSTPQFTIPIGGGNNGLFGNGNNSLADLFGFAIIASMFGWNNGGFGNGGNGGNTAYLSNQLANDSGRQLVMQAITSQGEQSRQAIQTLSTMLGQDFNSVQSAVQNVQNSLNQIANQQGTNTLQIINSINSGNAALAAQFSQYCSENRLGFCQLGNTIGQGFAGVQQSIAAKAAADQMALFQQTTSLNETANRNYLALDNKIDAMESARKDREIAAKDAEIAALKSQNFTAGVVQQAVTPILGQIAALKEDVASIKRCQPPTITLPNNQFTAVPTFWANAGADFIASYYANRLSGATTNNTASSGGGTAAA